MDNLLITLRQYSLIVIEGSISHTRIIHLLTLNILLVRQESFAGM